MPSLSMLKGQKYKKESNFWPWTEVWKELFLKTQKIKRVDRKFKSFAKEQPQTSFFEFKIKKPTLLISKWVFQNFIEQHKFYYFLT